MLEHVNDTTGEICNGGEKSKESSHVSDSFKNQNGPIFGSAGNNGENLQIHLFLNV